MSIGILRLRGFTLATVNMPAMVQFYSHVFDAQLKPFSAFDTTLYGGQLAGFDLLLCPNEVVQIQAEKNRQQLSFWVDNLEGFIEKAVENAGNQMQPICKTDKGRTCGITDPDGNSIELIELSQHS